MVTLPMNDPNLSQYGFTFNKNSTHLARTIMLEELTRLLDWVNNPMALHTDYIRAIIEENCLQKTSINNRKFTARHLVDLYALDPSVTIYNALTFFWNRDKFARPILALLTAYTRDSILRRTAKHIVELPIGSVITHEDTEQWIDSIEPGHYSHATLRSTARNLHSSWTQAGFLTGKAMKTRTEVSASVGAAAYALFLSHLSGARGEQLFHTEYVNVLDCPTANTILLAQEASQRGWVSFKRVGNIVEILFPNFLPE